MLCFPLAAAMRSVPPPPPEEQLPREVYGSSDRYATGQVLCEVLTNFMANVQCCPAATTARSGGPDFAVEMFPVITVHNPPASRKPSLDESGAEECTLTIYYEASLALHEEQCPAHDNPTFPNLPSGSPLLSPIRGCTLPAPGCRGTPQLSKSIKVCFNALMF